VSTLQWNAPQTAKAVAVQVVRKESGRTLYGPDDPQLQSAVMALSGPLYNGQRLSDMHGGRTIKARFDNAQYAPDMQKHWAMADYLGPDAAANQGVRYLLRIRSRYEVANNSYARGIVTTIANDTIGAGPQLHMTTPDKIVNKQVRVKFEQWCDEIDLSSKLRTMRMAKCQDGEAFAVQAGRRVTKDHVARGGSPVELNVRIVEADQCATVSAMMFDVPSVDGIELDEYFQPKNYFILRIHPGNYAYLPGYVGFPWDYDTFPADKVCHWFRKDRPELHRGIPEITPALNLFAQLRDFTNSILKNARIQSAWAISIQTNAPAGGEAANVAPMDTFDFEDGMAMTMPAGWEAKGFNPTNPPAAYATFKRELLCEIGRCINMPLCVIAGDSSGYNYASGRLDFQVYWKSISVDRAECELSVLEKIFRWWLDEAVLIEGYLPQAVRNMKADVSHEWFWPGESHVDPTKESAATQQNLGSCVTNLRIEYAKQGRDWEPEVRQRGEELKLCNELGITLPQAMAAPPQDETGDGDIHEEQPAGAA